MKSNHKSFAKILGAAALAALLSLSACKKAADSGSSSSATAPAASGNTIVIGEVGSMTGSEATFGTSTRDGIQLAINQVNAAGGILGKKVEVVAMDDQGKPDEAATATTKLITQNKVVAVLGEVASSRSMAMAPIAQQYKIPMVTPSSTNPKVTELGDYVFRVCFIDPFQGLVMAKFAAEVLKVKKVAILRDVKSDYSMGLAQFFIETFKKLGGEIVVDQSYGSQDVDFKSQLTAIRAKKPEAIFVPGYYTEVGLIARQAKELGMKVPLMGGDGWDSPKLTEIGQDAIVGSYFSNHYTQEDTSPNVVKFVTDFKAAFNVVPDGLAAMGYDAAMVLFDAMRRAGTTDSAKVREALATTKDYPAVTGNITINEKRDAVKSAVVLKVEKDGFKYQTTVKP